MGLLKELGLDLDGETKLASNPKDIENFGIDDLINMFDSNDKLANDETSEEAINSSLGNSDDIDEEWAKIASDAFWDECVKLAAAKKRVKKSSSKSRKSARAIMDECDDDFDDKDASDIITVNDVVEFAELVKQAGWGSNLLNWAGRTLRTGADKAESMANSPALKSRLTEAWKAFKGSGEATKNAVKEVVESPTKEKIKSTAGKAFDTIYDHVKAHPKAYTAGAIGTAGVGGLGAGFVGSRLLSKKDR
jgi:hypothetical protein